MHNTYYKVCTFCGANLDPDERCTCLTDHEVIDLALAARAAAEMEVEYGSQ